jgi:Lrp/AsnC family transcriptional regulator, regulator for asnA, asnC and gidA
MDGTVEIDDIDDKILHILIEDARTSLKDIAKECNVSSVSVLNRIKRLKNLGVITGATLFTDLSLVGFHIVATIGMETDSNPDEIINYFKQNTYLIEPATSVGEYDLCALIYAENISSLNEKTEAVRKRFGIRKVIVNVWSGIPHLTFENIDLNPLKKRLNHG